MEVAQRFNNLTLEQKCTLVTNFAKLLHYTDFGDYRINLYELEGEYVELWFEIFNKVIWQIRMPTYEQMDVHLSSIWLK